MTGKVIIRIIVDAEGKILIQKDHAAPSVAAKGRWGQERRLEFIDTRLCWDGRLNRSALTDFFGISVPQASLDLSRYMADAPSNTAYDTSEKAYIASQDFQPRFTDGSSARYLAELYALTTRVLARDISFLGFVPPTEVVRSPARVVPTAYLRQTLTAIRGKRQLTILYQTMNHPEPVRRTISPHALGYDGFRWHVRAYCHLRSGYRDFVFARILQSELGEASSLDPTDDVEWQTLLEVVIGPNPALAEGPRRAIALDYGMKDGELRIPTRQAFAYYLLKRLGLLSSPPPDPAEQHIVLINRDELRRYVTAMGPSGSHAVA